MKLKNEYEFWFVVGSQHLYGDDALKVVEDNTKEIVNYLNENGNLGYKVVYKDIATTAETITEIMKEANYNDNVAGVITWMHTFSPAKMWIKGTKLLQKPLLHFATQHKVEIPWDTIDMDYMNINQSAHGDREYGYINARLNKNNAIIFGHWQDKAVNAKVADWMSVAVAVNESDNVRVARLGDNMRNVAVTEGDKVEAAIKFGWTVDYFGIGDLVAVINEVTDAEIDELYSEYQESYDFVQGDYSNEEFEKQVKGQAKIEIGLKRFLDEGKYNAFSTNFEDLYGMDQLPGLAVQRLMEQGYGFAGEGDWKTAALDRLMKVMSSSGKAGFMEDYTYELTPGSEMILQSHMLEVDPIFSAEKPRVVVSPLSMGDKSDPARLVFDGQAGEGIVISLADFGTEFKVLSYEVDCYTPEVEAPNLPVARVLWKPKNDFNTNVEGWLTEGGGHHTVLAMDVSKEQVEMWAKMVGVNLVFV